jgi:Ran-binding protein 9/10
MSNSNSQGHGDSGNSGNIRGNTYPPPPPYGYRRSSYASVVAGVHVPSPAASSTTQPQSRFSMNYHPAPPFPASPSIPLPGSSGATATFRNALSSSRPTDSDWNRMPMPSGPSSSFSGPFSGGLAQSAAAAAEPPKDDFFIPTYLSSTCYAERLRAQHAQHLAASQRPQPRSRSGSQPASLSTSSSSINLAGSASDRHKMVPSHRGLTHDIVEHPPAPMYNIEEPPAPLPSRWSTTDKGIGLDVFGDGLQVKYTANPKGHDEAACIRADWPMPKMAGIYYFEIQITSKHREGYVMAYSMIFKFY